jgi:hypothetical protein
LHGAANNIDEGVPSWAQRGRSLMSPKSRSGFLRTFAFATFEHEFVFGRLARSAHLNLEYARGYPFAQAASLTILAEYERAPDCVEALGALNRWPGRSGVPIEDYLRQWEASCAELQASPLLPTRRREILRN